VCCSVCGLQSTSGIHLPLLAQSHPPPSRQPCSRILGHLGILLLANRQKPAPPTPPPTPPTY
jgi:hypothetical protein